MERKIEKFLKKWKNDQVGKPLVVYGSKQIGKTFTVLKFGKENYKNTIYINTEYNKKIKDLFIKEKSIERIIDRLQEITGETIFKEDSLIIFDNLLDIEIAKGIKLFGSEHSSYNIITITSRKDKLNEFKGEELQFKAMNEMDFEEYLWANNEKNLANQIKDSFENKKTCRFHEVALEYFKEYLVTGGYPEVIYEKVNGRSYYELDAIKQKIIDIIKKEISLNENLIDITRGIDVFNSMPEQLLKENKKFQYGIIGNGRRAKEYESSINYLVNNQILYRSYKIKKAESPLSSCKENDSFKLYLPDDGILQSMIHNNKEEIDKDENLKETLYENHIAKTLVESGYVLYYYQSEGKAEVNFVVQNRTGKIIPIEITIKSNSKAKSLSVFMKKNVVTQGFRVTENNFQTKKDIRYIPIYSIFCLKDNKI